jgi:hypothetical protein
MRITRIAGVAGRSAGTALLAAVLLAGLLASSAKAQVACADLTETQRDGDEDDDGFPNGVECDGIALDAAGWGDAFGGDVFPHVSQTDATCAATECVDVNRKDVFVMTVPLASGGVIGSDLPPAVFLALLKNEAGLNVHELRSTNDADFPPDRRITASAAQPAVKVVESNNVAGVDLGFCFKSPPTVAGVATIYAQRIRNRVNSQCAASDQCKIEGQTGTASPTAIVAAVTAWVSNHEVLHCLDVTTLLNPVTASYHLPTSTTNPVVMQDTYIHKVRKKQGDELFTIPARLDPSDPPSIRTN